jgi:coenzyme F420-dependent glucose-6-phosphate dehydrogenase
MVASRWLVSDDPDEMVDLIATYVGYGFTHLVFHAPGPDQIRFLGQFSSLVLPQLRTRFARSAGEETHVRRTRVL